FFDAQSLSYERYFLRIQRELHLAHLGRADAEKQSERVGGEHKNAGVVLSQRVVAVRAEFQFRDVRPQRRVENLLRYEAGHMFFAAQTRVADDFRLPVEELA